MDYCTVKLVPTAVKLTVRFSCNLRREGELFSIAMHAANNDWNIVFEEFFPNEIQEIQSKHLRGTTILYS